MNFEAIGWMVVGAIVASSFWLDILARRVRAHAADLRLANETIDRANARYLATLNPEGTDHG